MAQPSAYPKPPSTDSLMFYIQRNLNSNTIVYETHYDAQGNIDDDKPLTAEWIRYDEDDRRQPLSRVQRTFAYGLDIKKDKANTRSYEVELVAYKARVLHLQEIAPHKAVVLMQINGKTCALHHIYIQADNSGLWPKVHYVELFGTEWPQGMLQHERITNE